MAVSTETVALRFEDIVADLPIAVAYPLYETTDVYVYYGLASLEAVRNTDYTVTLGQDFDTFSITPTSSLLAKINALIAADANETNYVVVRRRLDYETDATPAGVRYTPFTSREFDRTALRFQQIQEQLNRAIVFAPNFVGDSSLLTLAEVSPGHTLQVSDNGLRIVPGPTADEVANAETYAEAALASENAAATSETNAANAADAATAAAATVRQRYVPVDVVDTTGGDPATDYAAGETIDGLVLVTGWTVLRATEGGNPADGIYTVPATGAASRTLLFEEYDDMPGAAVRVMRGSEYAATDWRVNSVPGGTINVTPLLIGQFSSGVALTASLTELQALDTASGISYLSDERRYGFFKWDASDLSTQLYIGAAVTSTAADDVANTFTKAAHGFVSLLPVLVAASVNGFAVNTVYWTIRVDANTFKLASTLADARSGTSVDFSGTDNITVRRVKDPAQGVYVIPTGSNLDGSQGCWVRQDDRVDLRFMGARADNSTDDLDAFQHASNFGGHWNLEAKAYRINGGVSVHDNGVGFLGQGLYKTIINDVSAGGQTFYNPWFGTTTLIDGFTVKDLQITKVNITSGAAIIALKNMQRWLIDRVYFFGAQNANTYLVDARGTWPQGTYYGRAKTCVFGLCTFGIYASDGFNNNAIEDCRFQQASPSGAQGFTVLPSAPGFSSCNKLDHCSFELPGNTMTGMYINNVKALTYDTTRFESLAVGMTALSGCVDVEGRNSYFESCTTKINNASTGLRPVLKQAGTFNGVGGVVVTGQLFGCTVTRLNTGEYRIDFTSSYALADYQFNASAAGQFSIDVKAGLQLTWSVTIEVRNRTTGNLADAGLINFTIHGQET